MITRTEVRVTRAFAQPRMRRALLLLAIYCVITFAVYADGWMVVKVAMALPAALGTALSILLGFRTNAAYSRWWEARQVWGGIVNDSRSFARKVLTLVEPAEGAAEVDPERKELVLRQVAWCYALSRALRKQEPVEGLDAFLAPEELRELAAQDNKPNAMLQTQARRLTELVAAGRLDSLRRMYLDDTLTRLCDHMGKCERIKNTVFPYTYSYLVSLLLYVFGVLLVPAMTLQLGLIGTCIAFVVTGIFMLIEATAYYLQDPFEDRPMDTPTTALSRTIEINLRQMLGQRDVPPKLEPVDGILM